MAGSRTGPLTRPAAQPWPLPSCLPCGCGLASVWLRHSWRAPGSPAAAGAMGLSSPILSHPRPTIRNQLFPADCGDRAGEGGMCKLLLRRKANVPLHRDSSHLGRHREMERDGDTRTKGIKTCRERWRGRQKGAKTETDTATGRQRKMGWESD